MMTPVTPVVAMAVPASLAKEHEQEAHQEKWHQAKEQARARKEKTVPAIIDIRSGRLGGRGSGCCFSTFRGGFTVGRGSLLPGYEALLVGFLSATVSATAEKAQQTKNQKAQKEKSK